MPFHHLYHFFFKPKPPAPRRWESFGKHALDFEHGCKFRHQIESIGQGTGHGTGETVRVAMKSGKTAIYTLHARRTNYVFEDTGQRDWRFLFMQYAS